MYINHFNVCPRDKSGVKGAVSPYPSPVEWLTTDINSIKPLRICVLLFQAVAVQRKGKNLFNITSMKIHIF